VVVWVCYPEKFGEERRQEKRKKKNNWGHKIIAI